MTTPLKQYRLRKKWSLRHFATLIANDAWEAANTGLPPLLHSSLVSKWERGLVQPSLEYALAIQRLCGRSVPLPSLLVRR